MSISERKHVSEVIGVPAQRIEVFTGSGRRRSWTPGQKASIVAESYVDGEKACQVARRHGLTPQQLFTWRREARRGLGPSRGSEDEAPLFIPAVVEAPAPDARRRVRGAPVAVASIELEIGGVTVRVGRDAAAETIAAVIRALKAGA